MLFYKITEINNFYFKIYIINDFTKKIIDLSPLKAT